jgi:hypothetical protein
MLDPANVSETFIFEKVKSIDREIQHFCIDSKFLKKGIISFGTLHHLNSLTSFVTGSKVVGLHLSPILHTLIGLEHESLTANFLCDRYLSLLSVKELEDVTIAKDHFLILIGVGCNLEHSLFERSHVVVNPVTCLLHKFLQRTLVWYICFYNKPCIFLPIFLQVSFVNFLFVLNSVIPADAVRLAHNARAHNKELIKFHDAIESANELAMGVEISPHGELRVIVFDTVAPLLSTPQVS